MSDSIARIERVPLRSVWPHEAHDFTRWLADNFDLLNEQTALDIVSAETEQAAGAFSVDIVAETGKGRIVVIENQLEKSDHDHLGKVITYLTSFDAGAAVWVVGDARPEHLQAVSWLNEASSVDFYMFKAEAIRIGDSEPAPLLTLLVGPSDEVKEIGRRKGEMAEREVERRAFWVGFLELARAETPEFARISNPPTGTLLSTSSVPYQGVSLGYNVRQHDTGGYIYVLLGAEREVETRAVFEALHAQRHEIETAYGGLLEWNPPEGRKSFGVTYRLEEGGWRDRERWPEGYRLTIQGMKRFWSAVEPALKTALS